MTGFDPTAPVRDTDEDDAECVPGNVVPPESLDNDSDETTPPAAEPESGSGSGSDEGR